MMTITNEDNMLLMARYPDNYFDIAVVDPPYGVIEESKKTGFKGNSYDKTHSSKDWDIKPTTEYFKELKRVSKHQVIWGFQYFMEEMESTKSIIIWDKMNGDNFMNDCELAWTNCKGNNNLFKHAYIGRYNPEPIRIHPTQKPVALYKWILDKYAKQGDKILDTHLGSGSIAIACHDYKYDLTACELDKEYFDKAMERINNHVAQQKLF
ncbi:MAG: Flavobacterium phage vB FspS snork6 [Bacteroidota bacterium]|jgi:site-specific DNA-methyltransferase (adenine-specific)